MPRFGAPGDFLAFSVANCAKGWRGEACRKASSTPNKEKGSEEGLQAEVVNSARSKEDVESPRNGDENAEKAHLILSV